MQRTIGIWGTHFKNANHRKHRLFRGDNSVGNPLVGYSIECFHPNLRRDRDPSNYRSGQCRYMANHRELRATIVGTV